MKIPLNKNKSWIAGLHRGIDQLDQKLKSTIMKSAGKACASELFALCEESFGDRITCIDDLVIGWNKLRDKRGLEGKWESRGNVVKAVFAECGCPLVRSGMIELHPVQCYCSQGMMETIFSQVSETGIEVQIKRSIGRGDNVCEFLIKTMAS